MREKVSERVADAIAEAAADDGDIDAALDLARDLRERLTETDRFGPLLNRPLIEVVGLICADIGVSPDGSRWRAEGRTPPRTTTPEVGHTPCETLSFGLLPAAAQAPPVLPHARRLE